ncbi:hypothetical protein BCR36DRAFT_588386, partial [Piromyces finnis]
GEYVGSYQYTNFTLNDIREMKTIPCKEDSECPDYSRGCELFTLYNGQNDVEYKLCDMTFICHKNETCLSLYNASVYYINVRGIEYGISFVNNNTLEHKEIENKDKIILHSCNDEMYKHNLCDTETCLMTENCYSGQCIHQTCMINSENPSYMCRIDWLKDEEKPAMLCKMANGETIRFDVCASPLVAEGRGKRDYFFIIGVAITIIIILVIIAVVTLFVMSCIYVAIDELKNILFNISDDYRQLENN